LIKRHASGGALLEIGPGGGGFLSAARRAGFDPYGVELNGQQAQFIGEQLGIPCVTSLDAARDLGPGLFDIAYSRDVLSHFHDPVEDIGEIGSLLRPGGLHVFETGNLGDVAHRHFGRVTVFQYPDHLFFYSERSIRELLRRSGFEYITTYRYSIVPELEISKQIGRITHPGRGRNDPAPVENGAAATGNDTATTATVVSNHASERAPTPSRAGAVARDLLDLTYLTLRLTAGRVARRDDDLQTQVVVSRKVS
jgi:SAM-dependent methyltransferase